MGRTPKDIDFCTDATPKEMREVVKDSIDIEIIPTGESFGTLTFHFIDTNEFYETTTYRNDGRYEDGRHPKEVSFSKNLEDDLKCRDFTINAIAYSYFNGYIDLFNGTEDIKRHTIRCVGDPIDRFNEDALRILRMVRFALRYNFDIDDATYEAAMNLYKNLAYVSYERIGAELTQIFEYELSKVHKFKAKNVLYKILISLFRYFDDMGFENSTSKEQKFYFLCEQYDVNDTRQLLNKFALGSYLVDAVCHVKQAMKEIDNIESHYESTYMLKTVMHYLNNDYEFDIFFDIMYRTFKPIYVNDYFLEPYITNKPYKLSQLAVNGDDIMTRFGVSGKDVGRALDEALRFVCKSGQNNDKETILTYLQLYVFS